MDNAIVWADCEMTGLNVEQDVLLEIAVVVTDDQLNILDGGIDIVIHAQEEKLAQMDDFVRDMHMQSDLISAVRQSTVNVIEAQQQIVQYIQQFIGNKQVPLAGNSIATDRMFIHRYMPELDKILHYRMIDVSSIKELARRWYPRAYYHKPVKGLAHRALADIYESVLELRYYRQAIFLPEPGYSGQELQSITETLISSHNLLLP